MCRVITASDLRHQNAVKLSCEFRRCGIITFFMSGASSVVPTTEINARITILLFGLSCMPFMHEMTTEHNLFGGVGGGIFYNSISTSDYTVSIVS